MKTFTKIITLFCFFGINAQNTINSFEYWFDNNYANRISVPTGNVATFNINTDLDVGTLTKGLHAINALAKDNNGFSSVVVSDFFYVLPVEIAVISPKIVELEYWFDNDYANKIVNTTTQVTQFQINENISTNSLSFGLHAANVRFKDEEGKWSAVLSSFFFKIPPNSTISDPKVLEIEYWFDKDYANKIVNTTPQVTLFQINENISTNSLSYGLHTANVRFKDEDEKWSAVLSSFFYKTPSYTVVLKDITAYEYWFNNDYANATKISIEPNQLENLNTFVVPENANLGIGNHYINIRFEDSEEKWSSILSEPFEIITLENPTFNTLKNVVMYPNPSNGELNFDFGRNYNLIKIIAYNTNGKKVYETANQNSPYLKIKLNLSSGFYLIKITADNESTTKNLIFKEN